MNGRALIAGFAAALACGLPAAAPAQTNPNQLVYQRKGVMNLQIKYLGPVLAMARGRIPYDAGTVLRNADYLSVLDQMPWDDFQPSTAELGERTRAKESIYKEPEKFKAKIDKLHAEVQKLAGAARAGNREAVSAAARDVGRACNSCHEEFATFKFRFEVE